MTDDELYKELKQWFDKNWGRANLMSRSKVAKLIKSQLEKSGNYKNRPRGNPKKGKRLSDIAKAKKAGGYSD